VIITMIVEVHRRENAQSSRRSSWIIARRTRNHPGARRGASLGEHAIVTTIFEEHRRENGGAPRRSPRNIAGRTEGHHDDRRGTSPGERRGITTIVEEHRWKNGGASRQSSRNIAGRTEGHHDNRRGASPEERVIPIIIPSDDRDETACSPRGVRRSPSGSARTARMCRRFRHYGGLPPPWSFVSRARSRWFELEDGPRGVPHQDGSLQRLQACGVARAVRGTCRSSKYLVSCL
jgi:hypothetical protein